MAVVLLALLALSVWPGGEAADDRGQPFYFPKYRPEVFYDNGVLPEDLEVGVHLRAAHTQRVYFLMEKEGRPLSLTITPCWQAVRWSLSVGDFPLPGRKESWHNRIPDNGSTPLASYSGTERKTYAKFRSSSGLYALELESRDGEAGVRIYLTTRSQPSAYYPRLPSDPTVGVLKVRRNKVLISWKASPSESDPRASVSYCVSVSPTGHRPALCRDGGTNTSPAQPPSAGFGFGWEKPDKKTLRIEKTDSKKKDSGPTCVGRKTWHVFRGLRKGTTYYLDVLAVDGRTNASSAYRQARATTRHPKGASRLKEGSLARLSLDADNGYSAWVRYPAAGSGDKLWIFVQSCSGPGPLTLRVSREGREVVNAQVMDTKTLSIEPPSNGTYRISVSAARAPDGPRRARLWVGRKYHKLPFPVLPEDRSVKIFDTLTTCRSVTLAWHSAVDEKVKYCVYRRTAGPGFSRLFASPRDSCRQSEEPDGHGSRLVCRRYHRFSRQRFNNVIVQRVRNLEPSFTYVFDVRVTKHGGKTLSYEPVWVTTAARCSPAGTQR